MDYATIIKDILSEEKMYEEVAIYSTLMRGELSDNVINPGWQRLFCKYYRLNGIGLSQEWKKNYFYVMKEQLGKATDFNTIIKEISIDVQGPVYASFASKLMATIYPQNPIYDSKVRFALGCGEVTNKNREKRIEEAVKIYNSICEFYNDETYKDFRDKCVSIYNLIFPLYVDISDVKKIDFVLWGMGKRGIGVKDFH